MCTGMSDRTFLVTLMDDTLPVPQTHQIKVNTPCACDLQEWVLNLPDLPFAPMLMHVTEELEPLRYESTRPQQFL
jgi:hypothetical protein